MAGSDRRGVSHPGFQAADFVPIARFFTIEVAQAHLNPKDAIAEALQRSLNDAFNPLNQLFIAADLVVAIDPDLHSPSPLGTSAGIPQIACRAAAAATSPFWLPTHRSLGHRVIRISRAK